MKLLSEKQKVCKVSDFKHLGAVTALVLFSCLTSVADEVAVTVYNSDLGVVSETRDLSFHKGIDLLRFVDVPSRIDPTSVRFVALKDADRVRILEQNYQFDLVSPEKLYQRYIDHEIELFANDGEIYTGKLLSYSSTTVTLLERSGQLRIIRLDEIANLRLPELPDGLITRPTLLWKYSSRISGSRECTVSYQTGGLSWRSEYVANLNDKENEMNLSGWASIENRSGKTYPEAKLKLVAGDINRAQQKAQPMYRTARVNEVSDAGFAEKAFFEYHLYTLPRPSTITNNEIKQLELFSPAQAGVSKEYHYKSGVGATNVSVKLRFANSEDNGLGIPLPAGRVRIFKQDSDGSTILLGEDNIQHTPKGEELLMTVGEAFDLVAEEITLDRRSLSKQVTEFDYQITLKNRKDDGDVRIFLRRSLGANWEILTSSHEFTKKSASDIEMEIPVSSASEVKVLFTVRYKS